MEKCDVHRLKDALLNAALGLKLDDLSDDGALLFLTKMRNKQLDLEGIRKIVFNKTEKSEKPDESGSGSSDHPKDLKRSREDEKEDEKADEKEDKSR